MARTKVVKVVEYVQMEFERGDVESMLFFLDKARTQMINDGSNTAANIAKLNEFEQAFNGTR